MMKNVKEWISDQLGSKSLLSSARPFNFFEGNSQDEDVGSQGVSTGMSSEVPGAVSTGNVIHATSGNQSMGTQPHQEATVSGFSNHRYLFKPGTDNDSRDPFDTVEKLQIDFLRLVHGIGVSQGNPVVAQVLYRLQLANAIRIGETGTRRSTLKIDAAKAIAAELEAVGQSAPDFSLKILVIGKTGVGKSTTINSILEETKTVTDAFKPATKYIEEVVGVVKGIKVTIIDTPGLLPHHGNQRHNRKIMHSIKMFIRKSPPDIVLYFERLDVINMGFTDFPLLKLMTDILGTSVWFNTIFVLTHASVIQDGPSGYPVNYEAFVSKCKNLIQHFVIQVISDKRLENLFLLVENHPSCKTTMDGEKVLPNGLVWRSEFLLLCTSMKIMADANALLKFHDSVHIGPISRKLPSLPHLLSSLLQPRLMASSSGSDEDFGELLDLEGADDYDQLPPIRILTKSQFQRLSKSQKKEYLDELEYRETLYLKKQLKEELLRRKGQTKSEDGLLDSNINDNAVDPADSMPLADMAIPLSFDPDYPAHRYRFISSDDQYLVRPVLDSQGWDHDVGFDGVNVEISRDINKEIHASIVGQMSKDKQESNILAEFAAKYTGSKWCTLSGGADIQTTGKDSVYTLQGGATIKNLGHNAPGGVVSLTSFGKKCIAGAKIEDSLSIGKMLKLYTAAGCIGGYSKMACGGSLEASVLGRDYPVRDDKTSLSLSCLSFDNETVLGGIIQSDFRLNGSTKMSVNVSLNSRKLGKISVKTSTTHGTEITLIALVSVVQALFRRRLVTSPADS